ncbi:hypothetical protein FACS189449_13330 [Alphaproteobacteria bacterium]|nr:hypothetical protein FACS189449_13330 [Alphaproteobacteria bacterium]
MYDNGNTYEGNWENSKWSGKGTLTHYGEYSMEGSFEEGDICKTGTAKITSHIDNTTLVVRMTDGQLENLEEFKSFYTAPCSRNEQK